jgi:Flp pilus assembly protein TadG
MPRRSEVGHPPKRRGPAFGKILCEHNRGARRADKISANKTVAGFAQNRSGATAMIFAIALPIMATLVGGSIDYASIASQQADLQSIADASALAVTRQMTMQTLSDQQIQAVAYNFALANAETGTISGLQLQANRLQDGEGAHVEVSAKAYAPLGLLTNFADIAVVKARATARIGNTQNKLCLLSVHETMGTTRGEFKSRKFVSPHKTGIILDVESRITAPGCVIHTNFKNSEAFVIEKNALVTANLLCAVGGITNNGGSVNSKFLSDCPKVENPMESRAFPIFSSGWEGGERDCDESKYKNIVLTSGSHTLNPGNYCGDILISGTARVKLQPGAYALQGVLRVEGDAELVGERVGLYLWGGAGSTSRPASFHFTDNAFIDLSAPETGPMAGVLIWEGVNNAIADMKKSGGDHNFHRISSARAKRLNGTIYLPGGRLLINAPVTIAEESDFTVLLVSRLDLQRGPNLVLNSDYARSRVPVPKGLGPIGAKHIRLEN